MARGSCRATLPPRFNAKHSWPVLGTFVRESADLQAVLRELLI